MHRVESCLLHQDAPPHRQAIRNIGEPVSMEVSIRFHSRRRQRARELLALRAARAWLRKRDRTGVLQDSAISRVRLQTISIHPGACGFLSGKRRRRRRDEGAEKASRIAWVHESKLGQAMKN